VPRQWAGGEACGGGQCSTLSAANTISFDDPAATSAVGTYSVGMATFSFGAGSPFVQGKVTDQYAAPPDDTSQFLSIGSPGRPNQVSIVFSEPILYYGLYLGSPDGYNWISFFDGATEIASFSGNQLIPPGNGDQMIGRYLNFQMDGGAVDKIVISSLTPALESDNHAYINLNISVEPLVTEMPEPTTLAMAGMGIAGATVVARGRHIRKSRA